jgi:hypothetical protein
VIGACSKRSTEENELSIRLIVELIKSQLQMAGYCQKLQVLLPLVGDSKLFPAIKNPPSLAQG